MSIQTEVTSIDQARSTYSNHDNLGIKNEYQSINNSKKQKYQPNQNQLCQTVLLIKSLVPHRCLQRTIIMIYQQLLRRKQDQDYQDGQNSKDSKNQVYINPNQVAKSYDKTQLQKNKFQNIQEQNQYAIRRIIAKAFVGKGYNYNFAMDLLINANKKSIGKKQFQKYIGIIMPIGFRYLQEFLKNQCNKPIVPISKQVLKIVIEVILHPDTKQQAVSVFKKYLKFAFGLTNVTLIEGESYNCYLLLLKLAQQKIKNNTKLQQINSHYEKTIDINPSESDQTNQIAS